MFSTDGDGTLRLKRQAGAFWRRLPEWAAVRRNGSRVLLYHAVGESAAGITPQAFAAQMEMLRDRVRVVSLATLLTDEETGSARPACAVTFDDGYGGVSDHVLPVLAHLELPVTVYLTTDAIGPSPPADPAAVGGLLAGERMLTWHQARELSEQGVMIGSHLCRHLDLTKLSEAEAHVQLERSKRTIEECLGRPCVDVAYPWGRYNAQVAGWVRAAGYRSAAAGFHAPVPRPIDPYAIPRIAIRAGYSLADFEAILNGEWDFLGIVQRARLRLSA